MANSKDSKGAKSQITIDTDPGTDGYWSDPVNASAEKARFLLYAQEGDATVTIQFKQPGGTWTDLSHSETVEDGAMFVLDTAAAPLSYRIGIKDNNQGTGTTIAGLYWNI